MTSRVTLYSQHMDCSYSSLPWVWVHTFYFSAFQLVLDFCSPYLNKALEATSFSSQACITPNKHDCHQTLNLKHNILPTSRLSLFARIITVTLAFKLPYNKKCKWCGFRSGEEEVTVPCLSFFHQKHSVNRMCRVSGSYLLPLTMKAYVQSHFRPCGICGGQSVAGSSSYPSPSTFRGARWRSG